MHGRIALELFSPGSGPHVLDSAGEGEVLDWPWLIPPYRWFFDARAVEPTSVVALDSACLRGKCEADPRLGYDLMQRVAQVMSQRLQATRVRLLDLYGPGVAQDPADRRQRDRATRGVRQRAHGAAAVPGPVRPAGHRRHLHARPGAGGRHAAAVRPGQFTMLGALRRG